MNRIRKNYPSDLTQAQWQCIKRLVPKARAGGRRRTIDIREVINAIFYITRTGCPWRQLPHDFPHPSSVYYYFAQWKKAGVWKAMVHLLAIRLRKSLGRSPTPSTVIIDGQSVRAAHGEERGWDGFKKVRGRKRQILVDTLGILWSAKVHRANQNENPHAHEVIEQYPRRVRLPKRLLGDFEYGKSPFDLRLHDAWKIWPTVRAGTQTSYRDKHRRLRRTVALSNLKPQRWIVERSFAWFNNFRRLNRDYERTTEHSEAFIYISQIQLLLNRLATKGDF